MSVLRVSGANGTSLDDPVRPHHKRQQRRPEAIFEHLDHDAFFHTDYSEEKGFFCPEQSARTNWRVLQSANRCQEPIRNRLSRRETDLTPFAIPVT